jgi:hypothetical protein
LVVYPIPAGPDGADELDVDPGGPGQHQNKSARRHEPVKRRRLDRARKERAVGYVALRRMNATRQG